MTASATPTQPARLDAQSLREWTASTNGPRLLDVRAPAEFTTAHIPGSYNVPLDLLREHRGLVLTGILASLVAPQAKWLSAAVGVGLTTAALTNTCAMGNVLSRLPYNRDASTDLPTVLAQLTGAPAPQAATDGAGS